MKDRDLIASKARQLLRRETSNYFKRIQSMVETVPDDLDGQVKMLFGIRSEIYELLNQLQHRSLILKAHKIISKTHREIDRWTWHPEQTSSVSEADLTGFKNGRVIVNAEVTTSERPVGTIDKHMASTLASLSRKKGALYYVVQTDKMYKRAKHKIEKNKWSIRLLKA